MNKEIAIEWVNALPALASLKPNSIYIVKPSAGVKPNVYVTNKDATSTFQINPDLDTTGFLKSVNGITGTNGNVAVDIIFNDTSGILSFTGGTKTVNFDARYVKLADFSPWKTDVDNKLVELYNIALNGMKTPTAFDPSPAGVTLFPTGKKGDVLKVTAVGTLTAEVPPVKLEIGDTIIYTDDYTAGAGSPNKPYVVQSNVDQATETAMGLVKIATTALTTAGTNDTDAVTPLKLQQKISAFLTSITASQAEVTAGTVTNKFVSPATLKNELAPMKTDIANLKAQTHSNFPVLQKIGEDAGGNMTYNGKSVYTLGTSEW